MKFINNRQSHSFITKSMFDLISIVIGCSVFCFVLYRSITLSITYDEVWTFDLASQSIINIISAEKNFNSANNHLLNSILIKPFLYLFGHHVWVLRLPNVLAYFIYFIATYIAVQHISKYKIIALVGLLLLNSNLYVLDFFSLSRGYGLALAFQMMSMSMVLLYITFSKNKFVLFSFLFAFLAVFANFTWLNFYAGLWVIINCVFIIKNDSISKKFLLKIICFNTAPLVFAICCGVVAFIPISYLHQQDEFKWGASTWLQSFNAFVLDFNYANSYYFSIITKVILVLVILFSLRLLIMYKATKSNAVLIHGFLFSLIAIIIFGTIIQRYALHTMYIDGRKALLYMPLLMCLMISVFDNYTYIFGSFLRITSLILIAFVASHFIYFTKINATREWWFDERNKEVIEYVNNNAINRDKSLIVQWYFESGITYYNKYLCSNSLPNITKLGDTITNVQPAYYYVFEDRRSLIPSNYSIVKKYNFGAVLLQRVDE